MKNRMMKIQLKTYLLSLFLCGSLQAQNYFVDPGSYPPPEPYWVPGMSAFDQCQTPCQMPVCPATPYAPICCEPPCCYSVSFEGSYLFWSVQEDQLGFAIQRLPLQPPEEMQTSTLITHTPRWDSGFRAAGGITNKSTSVGFQANWTHFETLSTRTVESDIPGLPLIGVPTISSLNSADNLFLSAMAANSRWSVMINEYGFDVDCIICNGSYRLRPYGGAFGAIIDQTQNIAYDGVNLAGIGGGALPLTVSRKNNFWGVGPRIGMELNCSYCNGITLFSNLNTALLFGKHQMRNLVGTPPGTPGIFNNIRENLVLVRPMASGLVGIAWKQSLCGWFTVSLSVAYEVQYWWKQWHNASSALNAISTGEGQWGDLTMQGLVASGGISF